MMMMMMMMMMMDYVGCFALLAMGGVYCDATIFYGYYIL